MTYQNLLIEQKESIIIITLHRPKALNALNARTMDELDHFFNKNPLPRQSDITGLVLTGAGNKSFVAGADIKEFTGLKNQEGQALSAKGNRVMNSIESFPKPVIAAVNGFALGGGCELAMACHLRIASEKARFGQPEVNLGLIPGYGGTQRLVQLTGKGKALELMMTAEMITANKALELGLVNQVVPAGEEVPAAIKMLQQIGTKAPLAIQHIIRAVNAHFEPSKDGYQTEIEGFGALTNSKDFMEGATAFIEKRKADFKGH